MHLVALKLWHSWMEEEVEYSNDFPYLDAPYSLDQYQIDTTTKKKKKKTDALIF